jgi:hypothetical protein
MADSEVIYWWCALSGIALFNLVLLFFAYRKYLQNNEKQRTSILKIRKYQFYLASLYTLGCGFRSILPRADLRRVVLVDHWISAVVIGRTVATIAELSFVLQWSFLLYEIGIHTKNKTILHLAKWPFPIIVIAETFSWYACTTSNYLGTIIEESLWAVAAFITLYGLILARADYVKEQLRFIKLAIAAAIGYIIYMVFVDVPAYVFKWLDQQENNLLYPSISEGLAEITNYWVYSRQYLDWQYEMLWMTLYFSVAVWMSIYLINAPKLDQLKSA